MGVTEGGDDVCAGCQCEDMDACTAAAVAVAAAAAKRQMRDAGGGREYGVPSGFPDPGLYRNHCCKSERVKAE